MLIFDVETLATESTCVVLSAAMIYFDPTTKPTYQSLLDSAVFVKFDAKEQVKLGRKVDKATLEWWDRQPAFVKSKSFDRSDDDVSAAEGLQILKNYITNTPLKENQTIWIRGSLDQLSIDSLAKTIDTAPIMPYNMYRDIRTAVDMLYGTTNGYVDIIHPEFDKHLVVKHVPYHDCAFDAMMLCYGEQK